MERKTSQGRNTLKVDKLGLGERIAHLIYEEKLSVLEVVDRLNNEGVEITRQPVEKWLNRNGYKSLGGAKKIFSEHIEKKLPTDLAALEGMEKECLGWFHETRSEFGKKATTDERVESLRAKLEYEEFRLKFFNTLPKSKRESDMLKKILSAAAEIVLNEMQHRKFKLLAGKSAASIIQTKLAFSGIIDGAGSGNIIIKPYGEDPEVRPNGKKIIEDGRGKNFKTNKVVSFKGR